MHMELRAIVYNKAELYVPTAAAHLALITLARATAEILGSTLCSLNCTNTKPCQICFLFYLPIIAFLVSASLRFMYDVCISFGRWWAVYTVVVVKSLLKFVVGMVRRANALTGLADEGLLDTTAETSNRKPRQEQHWCKKLLYLLIYTIYVCKRRESDSKRIC